MTKRELIDYCLSYPDGYEDYPFGDDWAVVRHQGNQKCFAHIFVHHGRLAVNLKCEPMQADFWRQVYCDAQPAYHMNKTHWNTVYPDGDVPQDELHEMITHSYRLTMPKGRKKQC